MFTEKVAQKEPKWDQAVSYIFNVEVARPLRKYLAAECK